MTHLLYPLLFILIGAYAIGAQIFFIRELMVLFFGNELCLGVIFFCWFLGITSGAAISGKIAKKIRYPVTDFLLVLIILMIIPFIIIPIMRLLRGILAVAPGEYVPLGKLFWGSCMTVAPFSFLVGFIFPIACRAFLLVSGEHSRSISWVYIWESVGSLSGGLLISLLLIPACHPLQVFAVVCGIVCIAACWLAFIIEERSLLKGFRIFFVILFGAMAFLLWSGFTDTINRTLVNLRWKTFNNNSALIASHDSRYQNIVLAEREGQYSIFANGELVGSYPDEASAALKAHFIMSQHPAPERVLVVGDGLTGLLKELLKHPVKTIDYVELDSELIDLVKPILRHDDKEALDNNRVTVHYLDGRKYIKECRKQYDVIIINTPDPSTAALNRYYTVEFFREIRRIMSDHGLLVSGLTSASPYMGEEVVHYTGSIYAGLKTIFPHVLVTPGDRNYFFASITPGIFTDNHIILSERFNERHISSSYFSPALFQWLLDKEKIAYIQKTLEKSSPVLNTDLQPITYFYNLVLWGIFSGERLKNNSFQGMEKNIVPATLIIAGIILCMGIPISLGRNGARSIFFNTLWAIAITGCTGMALEIVLIFSFQNIYGYVYQMIGVIAGSFMLGLSLGGFWMKQRISAGTWCGIETLLIFQIILCSYVMAVPFAVVWLNYFKEFRLDLLNSPDIAEYVYMLLVMISGFMTGAVFPLVGHILIKYGYDGNYVAGWVDSADHLGACAGSILTGVLFIPLAGLYKTCLLFGLLNVTGVLFLIIWRYSGYYRTQR